MEANKEPRRVIIDVDVGTDDFLALLLLFYAEKRGDIRIEAILCSYGNTSVENVAKNVVRLLETIGKTDVPVYKGAQERLIRHPDVVGYFHRSHGTDGFGDLKHDREPDLSIIKDDPAPVALYKFVSGNPKDISLICVGPLTNLALTIKLYGDFVEHVKDVWIMGGNYAWGNVTSSAEHNFYTDPEAARIVLECLRCPINLLPFETSLLPKITFEWRYEELGAKTPAMKLLTRAERVVFADFNSQYWRPCDAFLAFAFLDPKKHIIRKSLHHATIGLSSSDTRGLVIWDHTKTDTPNVTVIQEINRDVFKEVVLETGRKLF